jgi:hypothetical protein
VLLCAVCVASMAGGPAIVTDDKSAGAAKEKPERFPRKLSRFFLSTYYVLNVALAALSYLAVRVEYADQPVFQGNILTVEVDDFRSWEKYFFFLCLCSGFAKGWRCRSLDGAVWTMMSFMQLFVALMAAVSDMVVLAHLVIAYVLIYLLFPHPAYPLHDVLEHLTPEAFVESVKGPGLESSDVAWVVYFYADWHPHSRHMASMAAELACRYSTDKLQFGMLDLGEFRKFSGKVDIELAPFSAQLPTFALYEKGEELNRLPKRQGSKVYGADFRMKDVARLLELDMRRARSLLKAVDKKTS